MKEWSRPTTYLKAGVQEMPNGHEWDVAIIGSGVGALTAGALLAKAEGRRVLVLEKHQKVGGCTHSFKRKKDYHFDVGVHFVGSVGENSLLRTTLAFLTDNRLQWKTLPLHLDHVHLPEGDYQVPADWHDMFKVLSGLFPEERENLRLFMREVKRVSDAFVEWQTLELSPRWTETLRRAYLRRKVKNMFRPAAEVLKDYIKSPRLRLLLTSRWQALGLPMSLCSFGYFAGDMAHFAEGGWYPVGGGEQIAEELVHCIKAHGGDVLTSARVEKILVENNRALGVELNGQKVLAKAVISGAGAWSTYHRLLGPGDTPYYNRINQQKDLNSYVMAFMTLKKPPQALGVDAANHWIYRDDNSTPFFPEDPELSFFDGLWVGSPSLKRESSAHTLEFATLAPSELFNSWRDSRWRRRPEDYEAFKAKLFEAMMSVAEEYFPGLRDGVDYFEVSTPLTVEHFVTQAAGGLGIPATPERLELPWAKTETPIPNLFLTGSDVFAWGISGAIAGGLKTYRRMIIGRRLSPTLTPRTTDTKEIAPTSR